MRLVVDLMIQPSMYLYFNRDLNKVRKTYILFKRGLTKRMFYIMAMIIVTTTLSSNVNIGELDTN